jgi:hypothetical protein
MSLRPMTALAPRLRPVLMRSAARLRPRATLPIALVCIAATIPFGPALNGYFLSDDFGLIWLFVRKPPDHVLSLFFSPWTETIYGHVADELRPTIALSYQFDAFWGAVSPIAFHVSNIAVHAMTALVVFAIARYVCDLSAVAATFASVMFAVVPAHAETVAWISGRADSIFGLFYATTFLGYALWRRTGSPALFVGSLIAFFLTLFSKQSAITMMGTIVMFDFLVLGRNWRSILLSWRAYLPYALLTVGYLVLRYVLFGNAVREDSVELNNFLSFGSLQAVHFQFLVLGFEIVNQGWVSALALGAIAATLVLLLLEVRAGPVGGTRRTRRALLYFGPVWWLLSTAPLVVTYSSARHLYVAAVGVAIALGFVLESLLHRGAVLGRLSVAGAVTVALLSALQMQPAMAQWRIAGDVSGAITRDVERMAASAPAGSLLVLGAPYRTSDGMAYLWNFALPFAVQPPFTEQDLRQRVSIVGPLSVYCCPADLWLDDIRETITAWASHPERPPAVLLLWDAQTGQLRSRSETEDPRLRDRVLSLLRRADAFQTCEAVASMFLELDADWNGRFDCAYFVNPTGS